MILEAGSAEGPAASWWLGEDMGKEVPFEGHFGDGQEMPREPEAGGGRGGGVERHFRLSGGPVHRWQARRGSERQRGPVWSGREAVVGPPERHDSCPLRVLKVIERSHVSETRSRLSVGWWPT